MGDELDRPFVAGDVGGGPTWPVAAGLTDGRLTGIALVGRTLVWGQSSKAAGTGVVAAADVDGGETDLLATGLSADSRPGPSTARRSSGRRRPPPAPG